MTFSMSISEGTVQKLGLGVVQRPLLMLKVSLQIRLKFFPFCQSTRNTYKCIRSLKYNPVIYNSHHAFANKVRKACCLARELLHNNLPVNVQHAVKEQKGIQLHFSILGVPQDAWMVERQCFCQLISAETAGVKSMFLPHLIAPRGHANMQWFYFVMLIGHPCYFNYSSMGLP